MIKRVGTVWYKEGLRAVCAILSSDVKKVDNLAHRRSLAPRMSRIVFPSCLTVSGSVFRTDLTVLNRSTNSETGDHQDRSKGDYEGTPHFYQLSVGVKESSFCGDNLLPE